MFEQAIHARYLRPFAASLRFGIAVTKAILMMIVPALYSLRLKATAPDTRTLERGATAAGV